MTAIEPLEIRPHPGHQEMFMSSPADIVIGGGGAGGGKTFAMITEPCRHIENGRFNCVTFRRTRPEITNPGGMWDDAGPIYRALGATPNLQNLEHRFPSGAVVKFAGLQFEQDKLGWQGSQICLLQFDQLEHFNEDEFFYLLSRNRSTCGVAPYVRGTCNPDPDSWLAFFLSWWIDEKTGFPIWKRAGKIRWFVRVNEKIHWEATKAACAKWARKEGVDPKKVMPKSVTFVPMSVYDNPTLMEKDPQYLANLLALNYVDRMRLLEQNWKVRASAGKIINRDWLTIVDSLPEGEITGRVRYWDKAGTEGGGKYTVGVRMCRVGDGNQQRFYVEDVVREQWGALNREKAIRNTAETDPPDTEVWTEQEPGSGGKESAESTVRNMAGFNIHSERVTGEKLDRLKPFAAQAEARNIYLLRGIWNEDYLRELHNTPEGKFWDQRDASSGAFNKLAKAGYGLGVA